MAHFWKNKTVAITGANGFLGSHLSIALLNKGSFVIAIVKESSLPSYLKLALDKNLKPKLKIIKCDVTHFEAGLRIFNKYRPQICLHLAAQPIVSIADRSPLPTFEANIKGTWNILESARICRAKAILAASSEKTYGVDVRLSYQEDRSLLARHPYDASKVCADILARCYAYAYGLNTAVTRCTNIYGPGDFNLSRIIPGTIISAIRGQNPVIRSDGTPVRDYVYIADIVDAYLTLAERLYKHRVRPGEVFNFSSGSGLSVLSLVNKILAIASKTDLKPEVLRKRKSKGSVDRQHLSSVKARKMLGWESCYSLDKGLRATYAWYLAHAKDISIAQEISK